MTDQFAAYVYDPRMSQHVLREGHPMRPVRLQYTYALAKAYGAFDGGASRLIQPRPATEEELLSFHERDYVEAVRAYSNGASTRDAERHGFAKFGDNPVYPGMYEAALLACGASVRAAELVADKFARVAFAPAGGLHHAAAGRASGFCIFNDAVVAINVLRRRGLRVAYIDIDAHHGDGVQAAYYDDPHVLTISLHESGRYLFPGTGEVAELGEGAGRGFSVNLPLFPYTGDAVYREAFDAVVPPLLRAFAPDVIATQLGVDAHGRDPLSHLALTSRDYIDLVRYFAGLGLPWLAFGGGGYDLDVVARCWTMAYGVMLGREWPDELPAGADAFLTSERLRDADADIDPDIVDQTRRFARQQVEELRRLVFPSHGLTTG
ncbi:MAG: acetoin utilization protein AcuC [SAR202 cluster bacterium]|nr:acetoin utilization protein AcuC [SAR202 cluster bacterium]